MRDRHSPGPYRNCADIDDIKIDEFVRKYIISSFPPGKVVKEAHDILHNQNRQFYYGSHYVAVSSATKDKALLYDKESAKDSLHGIAVGLGDSGGDVPFLTLRFEDFLYVPFFVGEQSHVEGTHILRTKEEGKKGSKAVLTLLFEIHNKKTNEYFFENLKKLIENPEDISVIPSRDIVKVAVIYSDKDDTLTAPHQEIDPDIVQVIAGLLLGGARFVLVTSNEPEEFIPNMIEPVWDSLKERTTGQNLTEALLRLEVYFYNSRGHLYYNGKGDFVTKTTGPAISEVTKVMMFKIYIKLFLDFLINPEQIINDKHLILKLKGVYDGLNQEDVHELLNSHDYRYICEKFDELVKPYQEILGMPVPKSTCEHHNIYVRTWGDAFVTLETGGAKKFLKGAFPRYVYDNAHKILEHILSVC
jgi:hypothetical protein